MTIFEDINREHLMMEAAITRPAQPLDLLMDDPDICVLPLRYHDKYSDGCRLVAAPTLSMAITEALPSIAPGRAIFGARPLPDQGQSYGCLEITFPPADDRSTDGYAEWGVRNSVTFDDEVEIFDASEEFDTAEGVIRYRAQELGDDEPSLSAIQDGVAHYLEAFDNLALWDPKAPTDLVVGLNDLFEGRDWTRFVSPSELEVPKVTITNVECLPYDDDLALVRFDYINGTEVGREMNYLKLGGERLTVVRHGWSGLQSAKSAFKGRQLNQVYDALQCAVDASTSGRRSCVTYTTQRA